MLILTRVKLVFRQMLKNFIKGTSIYETTHRTSNLMTSFMFSL